jgi:hypothetical protein
MVEPLHDVIDQLASVLLTFWGKVEIEHGGFELGMAHVSLDDPEVDPGFEEMGGVGMPEGMNGNTLFKNASSKLGATEGSLDTTFSHGVVSLVGAFAISAKGREQQVRMAMGLPVTAQQVEGGLGEWDVAILGAFAPVHMNHHAVAVDIRDFEIECFLESEATGVHGGEVGIVLEGLNAGKEAPDFFGAKDRGKAMFILGSEDSEQVPIAVEDVLVEEAYAAIADAHSLGGPLINVLPL